MKKILIPLIICFSMFSCKKSEPKEEHCEIMKYGTFDVYQRDQKVGTFYRKDSMQVETYVGSKSTGLTKVKQVYKCQFMMRSHWVKKEIDTMNFTVNYTIKDRNEIIYEMSPTYFKTDSKLRGKIVKVSDSISADILKMFGN